MWRQTGIFLVMIGAVLFGLLGSSPGVAEAASGTGPADALAPAGETQTVAPNSGQWYAFELGGQKRALAVTLDAASSEGLRLLVYTPQQIADWQRGDALKSVGAGTPQETHALGWYGEFNQAGTYYAVVHNDSGAAVEVRVRAEGDALVTESAPTQTVLPDPLVTPTPVGEGVQGKLVFADASGGNIYTMNGDGTNLMRLTYGLDPVWNHAGTQIAFARQGPVPGIYVINADGTNERLLYQTNEPRSPAWSADDSEIVFSYQGATKGGEQRVIGDRTVETPTRTEWRLGAVQVSDGAYRDVRSSENAMTPTVNADGSTIAYNDRTIGLMRTTWTGEPEANPFIGDLRITSDSYNPLRTVSPQYSPDGALITYIVQQSPTWQIAVANADGSNQHLLTSDFVLWLNHPNNVAPQWSPDGSQIMFLSNRNGKWEFFTMNADGSNVRQVLKIITDQISIQYDYQAARMMSWSK